MADYRDNPFRQGTVAGRATQADIDQGLRPFAQGEALQACNSVFCDHHVHRLSRFELVRELLDRNQDVGGAFSVSAW